MAAGAINRGLIWEGSGWKVETSKLPILSAKEIDAASERLQIPVPEMIFGNNAVRVQHIASQWAIEFNALDALDLVDKTGSRDGLLKVSYAKEWAESRQNQKEADVDSIVKPFDWTYTTSYKGTTSSSFERRDEIELPLNLLKRPDPIQLYDEVPLYEDELGDNGIVVLNVKIRVMPERLLILSRLFLRVDDVVFRIRDTRVYIEFATGIVIREYLAREQSYDNVKRRVPMGYKDFGKLLRDPEWVCRQVSPNEVIRETTTVK
jgi:type 2A phosphatase activator TIP41